VAEDSARLALHSGKMCEPFKLCLTKYAEFVRLGSFARGGDRVTVRMLRECRERWTNRKDGDWLEEKLAFTLGWRGHNAADRQFKPVYREVEPEHYASATEGDPDVESPGDSRIYHDTVIFREIYRGGKTGPLPDGLLAYTLGADPVEDLIGGLVQRSLFELQVSIPKEADPGRRLTLATRRYQPFTVDIRRMSSAYYSPDPEKIRRFTVDNNFYDRKDPIIVLARSLQRGTPDRKIDVETAGGQSHYAQAIRKGYVYLVASNEYFLNRIGEKELEERLDLARPHV
jgi:hypothetical protein